MEELTGQVSTSRPVTLLPRLPSPSCSSTAVSLRLSRPPFLFPWGPPVRNGCVAIPAQCRLNRILLVYEAFCCFEDPAIPLARLLTV